MYVYMYVSAAEALFSLLRCALSSYQESGVSAQSLPSTSATERLGSNISEPLLTTGDALDKYQLVSEKVTNFSPSPFTNYFTSVFLTVGWDSVTFFLLSRCIKSVLWT